MIHGFIKVAAISPRICPGDTAGNADRIIAAASQAEFSDCHIKVFPELCVSGYTCGDLFTLRDLQSGVLSALAKLRDFTNGRTDIIIAGAPLVISQKLINCAMVLQGGRVLGIVPKQYLPNYGEFYEQRHFSHLDSNDYFMIDDESVPVGSFVFCCAELEELTFGVEICEDLWAVVPPSCELALTGANIILCPSAGNDVIGKDDYRRTLVSGQSGRLIAGYVYANAGEGESTSDMVFGGHCIIAENGHIVAERVPFAAGCNGAVAEIDVQKLAAERQKNTSFHVSHIGQNNVDEIYFDMPLSETTLTREISKTPFVPKDTAENSRRCEYILAMQAYGLKKRAEHIMSGGGQTEFVLGVSGGLDSCLALLVAVMAADLLKLPRTSVHAVTMPCFGTTSRTRDNSEKLCRALGVTFEEIDITNAVRGHFSDINFDENVHDVTYENVQARMRTLVLFDIANKTGGIVVGTGDLSEAAQGWATYCGDHMSHYSVNCCVPKTLVRYLVRHYAETHAGDTVLCATLSDILDTPVSPELLPPENGKIAQKTEEIIGPYELHDFFLYYMVRFGFSREKILRLAAYAFAGEYDRAVCEKWLDSFIKRFYSAQFKRSCVPDGPKIGTVSLSPRADWRMPSDGVL